MCFFQRGDNVYVAMAGNPFYLYLYWGETSQLRADVLGYCIFGRDELGIYDSVDKETIKNQIESVPGWLGSLPYQYRFLSLAYALTQSRGSDRTLDFVNYPFIQDRPGHLFIPEDGTKIAHDSFNFGNYLWGAGMRRLGIPLSVSLIGGNIDNLMHHKFQFDSADDMTSISLGYLFCPQPSLCKNYFGF